MLINTILTLHVLLAISIVVLVLLQHGKGADMGAAFGTGSAGSLFGSSGAANFLSRSTAVCAGFFFVTSLGLTYFYAPKSASGVMGGGVMQSAPVKDGGGKFLSEQVTKGIDAAYHHIFDPTFRRAETPRTDRPAGDLSQPKSVAPNGIGGPPSNEGDSARPKTHAAPFLERNNTRQLQRCINEALTKPLR